MMSGYLCQRGTPGRSNEMLSAVPASAIPDVTSVRFHWISVAPLWKNPQTGRCHFPDFRKRDGLQRPVDVGNAPPPGGILLYSPL